MKNFTIHIFGYGEAQVISETVNFKAKVADFTKLKTVIDNIKSKKPADKTTGDYHAINIFGDMRADYNAKRPDGAKSKNEDKSSFSVKFADLDIAKLNALIAEFVTLSKAVPA